SNNTYLAENSDNHENNINDNFIALKSELDFGIVDSEVRILQEFLRDQGYFDGKLITDYFGPLTQEAVLQFQLDKEIVTSSGDQGAGRVGPATLELINSLA
ncbi:hypothetical protein GF366_02960, partial [Candidatus Peregrinibacteria bacterium]|nr:hypothetical protein [Candidatus Peregrinibacteria bacterium]